ncbi:ferritin [bacterium]|nr:ferritin [bacterium]
MSSESLHEPFDNLSETTLDMHRALISLIEELEAVDWYQQRVDATKDEALKAVLTHNMNEEWEHAAMALEWLRRNNSVFAGQMDEYWKKDGAIAGSHG